MTQRQDQVKEQLHHLAAEFISLESNRESLVTVTGADISPDFANATIYITVMPESKEEEVMYFLKRRGKDFRSFVVSRTSLRRIPFFEFKIDEGDKNRRKIDDLLQ